MQIKIHLACGQIRMPGWTNVDIVKTDAVDQVVDLSKRLPWSDDSVDYIFHEHFLEHLPRGEGVRFLIECRRILKKDGGGGVMRIVTPDVGDLARRYFFQNIICFPGVWEPKTRCQMLNEGMRLWGHEFIYDDQELRMALAEAGFSAASLRSCDYKKSDHQSLCGLDNRPPNNDLILEAIKK